MRPVRSVEAAVRVDAMAEGEGQHTQDAVVDVCDLAVRVYIDLGALPGHVEVDSDNHVCG